MAFLLGRQHERRDPSDSSVVSGSMLPDFTSIPRVEGSDCDTVKGEIEDGHSCDGTVVRACMGKQLYWTEAVFLTGKAGGHAPTLLMVFRSTRIG